MNKEKARPIVAATGQAAGTAAYDRAAISHSHSTTAAASRQLNISDLLCRGQEHAVTLRDLRSMTGRDGRSIRRDIEIERRNGVPILSDGGGYYLPATRAEVGLFVCQMRGRAKEILVTAAAVEQCSAIKEA